MANSSVIPGMRSGLGALFIILSGTLRCLASCFTCVLYSFRRGIISAEPSPYLTKKPVRDSVLLAVPITSIFSRSP
ncbi:hypothetical protein ES705_14050 [subsurface metagenome]